MVATMAILLACLLCTAGAFSTQNNVLLRPVASPSSSALAVAEKSTYKVDSSSGNENAGAAAPADVNGASNQVNSRFGSLLDSVGLQGKLKHTQDLPRFNTVTPNDVFCNRELKMSGIRAIGFDMVRMISILGNGHSKVTTQCCNIFQSCLLLVFHAVSSYPRCLFILNYILRITRWLNISSPRLINWHLMAPSKNWWKISATQRKYWILNMTMR